MEDRVSLPAILDICMDYLNIISHFALEAWGLETSAPSFLFQMLVLYGSRIPISHLPNTTRKRVHFSF